jgi:hypothetical protein
MSAYQGMTDQVVMPPSLGFLQNAAVAARIEQAGMASKLRALPPNGAAKVIMRKSTNEVIHECNVGRDPA